MKDTWEAWEPQSLDIDEISHPKSRKTPTQAVQIERTDHNHQQ